MNTASTGTLPRPQRRGSDLRSWGVRRGHLAPWELRGLAAPWGVKAGAWCVLREGVTKARPAAHGDTIVSARGPVAAWGIRPGRGFGRANFVHGASGESLNSQRSGERSPEVNPLARVWAGVRPSKNGGGCRAASPAGSRAEPGRRRPRGQPPAGKVECRSTDLRPGGCPLAELSWPAAWAFAGFGAAVGGVDEWLAALVAVGPA